MRGSGDSSVRVLTAGLVAAALLLAGARVASSESDDGLVGELEVQGMTFVGSRGDVTEFVLEARAASFSPTSKVAQLQDVQVNGNEAGDGGEFLMSCARGELDVETSNFLAEGDVRGQTGDGRRYEAPWVRYDHEQSLLYSDAPVLMEDSTGTFRGDGFRYHMKDGSFRLLGNVRVVQAP